MEWRGPMCEELDDERIGGGNALTNSHTYAPGRLAHRSRCKLRLTSDQERVMLRTSRGRRGWNEKSETTIRSRGWKSAEAWEGLSAAALRSVQPIGIRTRGSSTP